MPLDPANPPAHNLPPEFFKDWNPLTVNEFLRRQSRADQVSIAIAASRWAWQDLPGRHPAADYLALAQDDLTQAMQFLQKPESAPAGP